MKILLTPQIRALDQYTIANEPIASIDLMERASLAFVKWFSAKFTDKNKRVRIFCGPGNNGGDGLAIARLLSQDHYNVQVYLLRIGNSQSADFQINRKRLEKARCCLVEQLTPDVELPQFEEDCYIIDAVFGSGLSRPVSGFWGKFLDYLNRQAALKIAVDIPSGMFADQPTTGISFRADYTFSFEMPKLGFLFPENSDRVGEWFYESIGLHQGFLQQEATPYYYLDAMTARSFLRPRKKYSHKGTFGHALLVAGSKGKIGAGVLAARAVLRSGAGLLTVQVPDCGCDILQSTIPEAMVLADKNKEVFSGFSGDIERYNAIGIGPGIGTNAMTARGFSQLLEKIQVPVVLDADALNLLAANPKMLKLIPPKSILTPHPKEYERLFGASSNHFARNEQHRQKAQELDLHIILKGAHTAIANPDGTCFFNSTGNPGMATGGSGDVLTGILTGLLAQGYEPFAAALLGVYLHGLAGDLAAGCQGQEALLASDITDHLGAAFLFLKEKKSDL